MAAFEIAFALTKQNEGEYANHPADRGGETYSGISRKNWPKWQGWEIVDAKKKAISFPSNLAKDTALQFYVEAFYRKYFWNSNYLDNFNNQSLANEMFDTGVNIGARNVAKMLQEALNFTNLNRKLYKEVAVDGKVGPETINTTNKHPKPAELLRMLNCLQAEWYLKILRLNPSQEVFATSWFNRVEF